MPQMLTVSITLFSSLRIGRLRAVPSESMASTTT
jgi:hypothetical protein